MIGLKAREHKILRFAQDDKRKGIMPQGEEHKVLRFAQDDNGKE